MNGDARDREVSRGRPAVVTYSRITGSAAPEGAPERLAIEEGPPELTAVEVPYVEVPRRADAAGPAPEIRVVGEAPEDFADIPPAALKARRRRSRPLRFLMFVALAAIVIGVGVLALSFRAATVLTGSTATPGVDTPAGIASIKERMDTEAGTPDADSPGVRSVTPGAADDAAAPVAVVPAAPAVPPVPRPRPEHATAALDSGKTPVDQSKAVAADPGKPAADQSDADYVKKIERILADVHDPSGTPAAADSAPVPAAGPAPLSLPMTAGPAPLAPAPAADGSLAPGPVVLAPPPAASAAPLPAETEAAPANGVLAIPPAPGTPVPPEPIPNVARGNSGQ